MSRNLHHQLNSKTTEKGLEVIEGSFSSLKKSERSQIVNQNLGSLIFETPPKGTESRSFGYMSLNRFLDERI